MPAGDYSGGAEEVCIQAEFDDDGRLLVALLREVCRVRESFVRRLGRWLGL